MQWVYNNEISSYDEAVRTFNFPLAFPSTCYFVITQIIATSGLADQITQVNAISKTQYKIIKNNLGGTGNFSSSFYLIAMGS